MVNDRDACGVHPRERGSARLDAARRIVSSRHREAARLAARLAARFAACGAGRGYTGEILIIGKSF